ncbi:nucleotidyltransferase family protein [Micromonospora chokoriensis]|uniref:NDP-sugar pyrophosphorylase, includes eIF-2Bgamma, eIF-2Bepsilon, and LPS biosynthesis proteins n=1 Tax=Micromonospora chokoriensis TaxID=356851 RepID=A0A1C4WVL3_9ACTN|nr:sugar phosphate nucleotidyltransferase [Micromonospora chokoriensis]SCF00184.1 NDP-sugar pyrophosphorylase, includes eIF-2Bgamma, eIF-2Bepsilon, and LPS biosynthesis proteins [Micromonospora chokoriensis]
MTGAGVAAELCAVVLAAGEGTRLRPLTERVPKALCPVGNVPLLDRALARLAGLGLTGPDRVAVNACYLGDQVVAHVGDRAHLSVEVGDPLGTAGGVANLRDWIDGRPVLVGNADAYLADPTAAPGPDVAALLADWDGHSVRLLGQPAANPTAPGTFDGHCFTGFSLLPWRLVHDLPVVVSDLVHVLWRPAEAADALEVVPYPGTFFDTGTPADYLAANLHAAAGGTLVDPSARVTGRCAESVIGAGARVDGDVLRSVVWPGATVHTGERLVDVIRFGNGTVPTLPGPDRRHPLGPAGKHLA